MSKFLKVLPYVIFFIIGWATGSWVIERVERKDQDYKEFLEKNNCYVVAVKGNQTAHLCDNGVLYWR